MPASLGDILTQLETLAGYDGPWQPLRAVGPKLKMHLDELRARASRLDDVLVVALVGGSGVGKSTLLNALAGDELAATSEFRPCTSIPTVYHPPGVNLDFGAWKRVSGSALEYLVLVDTPDSDTIMRAHREAVIDVLRQCDLVIICASNEKYLDEATWSLLRPLRGERTFICVETKAHPERPSVRDHWLERLKEQGIETAACFRVNARAALDQKLAGQTAPDDGFDFTRLESFLRHELTRERIRRIKRSNVAGLLMRTVALLHETLTPAEPALDGLEECLANASHAITEAAIRQIDERLFIEPHLWRFAMGREMAARAKGITGMMYRLMESLRTAPARLAARFRWFTRDASGQRAAALLADRDLFTNEPLLNPKTLEPAYRAAASEVHLAFSRAGFSLPIAPPEGGAVQQHINAVTTELLRGPARSRIAQSARKATSWPATLAADALPLAFIIFFAWKTVRAFFSTQFMSGLFFAHAASVLAIILLTELLILSWLTRAMAWSARRRARSALLRALNDVPAAFPDEQAALNAVMTALNAIETIRNAVMPSTDTTPVPK